MAQVMFLLQLYCVASLSQSVTRRVKTKFNLSSIFDISESDTNESGILGMIQNQSALCQYIPLCTFQNRSRSTLIAKHIEECPCCSEYSFNLTCILRGIGCTDVDYKMYQLNKTTAKLPKSKALANTTKGLVCVKTNHGKKNRNKGGYRMIASCPGNFTNITIIQRCENTRNIMDVNSLFDVIPTFDKQSAWSYKNIFCYLCNKVDEAKDVTRFKSFTFWDIRVYCSSGIRPSRYFLRDPFEFAKSLLQVSCSIVFHNSEGTDDDSKACEFDDVIKTCKTKYAATEMEKMCKLYTWPISTHGNNKKLETFKNYACMLCNDRKHVNECLVHSPERSKSVILLTKIDPSTAANIVSNEVDSDWSSYFLINQNINRLFPDSKGQVLCKQGFIFDDQKNVCRQVFCPINFFLKNRECVPIFRKTIGIFYYHLFQVFLPATLDGEDTDAVEAALVFHINQSLEHRISVRNYNFSLWCDEHSQGRINTSHSYYALIILDEKYADGKYVEFLKTVYALRSHTFTLVLFETKGKSEKKFGGLKLHLTKNYRLQPNSFVGPSRKLLYLRKPGRFSIKTYIERANTEDVTISKFCYRVSINFSEINYPNSREVVYVKMTHLILFSPTFQRIYFGNDIYFLVCLEHALNGIAHTNKYIFDSIPTEQTISNGSRKVRNREDGNVMDRNSFSELETKDKVVQMERSIAAAILTTVIVIIVIGTTWLLKKLTRPL